MKFDETRSAYSRDEWVLAVNLSAFLGWLAIALPFATIPGGLRFVFGMLTVGIPIAFLVSWVTVAPILRYAMRNPISWGRAALWGALTAGTISAANIIIGRLNGLRIWYSSNSSFHIGAIDRPREVDGILTLYGWEMLALRTLLFIGVGVVVALLVRPKIGGGENKTKIGGGEN